MQAEAGKENTILFREFTEGLKKLFLGAPEWLSR